MALVTGFGACDLGAWDEAARLQRYAQALSEEAGNWSLRAGAMADQVHTALWAQRPDDALTVAELALAREDRIGAAERAMLHGLRARVLAKMDGREQDVVREVTLADDCYAQVDPTQPVPTWMPYYIRAEHDATLAEALADVGVQREVIEGADARYQSSVAGFGPTYRRSAALAALGNTRLHIVDGDLDRAGVVGADAVDRASAVRSRRTGMLLADIQALAAQRADNATMRDLREQAAEVLGSSA
jgi:hypothetical protein